ncbi:unnamed protein product [Caenorhabditis sp. 36 PRJEB53466]|nr:unnamed protein product [Caenorhabditis sp. 36 PRJEB53466]
MVKSDYPPCLQVGDELGAKYRACYYAAKIVHVQRRVMVNVLVDGEPEERMTEISNLKFVFAAPGDKASLKLLDDKEVPCVIRCVKDWSKYTVLFEDGLQKVVYRNALSQNVLNRNVFEKPQGEASNTIPPATTESE